MRTAIGLLAGAISLMWSFQASPRNDPATIVAVFLGALLVSVVLTDKYVHKYPYRYYTYILAAHAKAAAVLALLLLLGGWIATDPSATPILWRSFVLFSVADLAIALPRRRQTESVAFDPSVLLQRDVAAQVTPSAIATAKPGDKVRSRSRARRLEEVLDDLDAVTREHLRRVNPDHPPGSLTEIVSDQTIRSDDAPVDLLICETRINDLRRINLFFLQCAARLNMGGLLVCRYRPLEDTPRAMQASYGGLFRLMFMRHFLWHRMCPKIPLVNRLYFAMTRGKDRELSKAEVWGRLSFCGMRVVSEQPTADGRILSAQRVAEPITNRTPSYFPVVALVKVGLDGRALRTHKIRSMYPFSEFLQKQVFDDNGLASAGKFNNDFRLTEYGAYLRRYWLDELPQLFDWLRGDIKLVGIRATSPHFLSLYPARFIRLYVRVKPGLVPPLFDENTNGFEGILKVEQKYLDDYVKAPFRTDVTCLLTSLRDIVIRGVRSQ